MALLRLKNWLVEYRLIGFLAFIFFGWLVIWLGWVLFVLVTGPK